MDKLRVGSNVDAWCTKCKLVLAHTIEAVAAGAIKRVQCNTCRGKHQFKSSEPGTAKSSPKLRLASLPKNKSKASDYVRLLGTKDLTKASPYAITKNFSKGELINHVQFGIGIVVDIKDVTKIEVLFEAGPKVMVQGRK